MGNPVAPGLLTCLTLWSFIKALFLYSATWTFNVQVNIQSAEQPNCFKSKKVLGAGHYINYLCTTMMDTVKTERKCREFFCGAIWKHLKTLLYVLIAGLLYSNNAFKHQYSATHGDCEHYFIHCAICFLLVKWNDAMFHILFLPMTAATGLRKLLRAAWAVSSKHSHLGRHLGSRGRQVCSCQPPIPTGKTLHSQQKEPPGMLSHLRGLPGLLLTA